MRKNLNIICAIMFGGGQIPEANLLLKSIYNKTVSTFTEAELYGIIGSFSGMLSRETYSKLNQSTIDDISNFGTYLKTCRKFNPADPENFEKILKVLDKLPINSLVCTGGDGSLRALNEFAQKLNSKSRKLSIYYIPATIDGINGTKSIGLGSAARVSADRIMYFSTNAWATIDWLKQSFNRLAIIELMGRNRDDILFAVFETFQKLGKIGDYLLSQINIIIIPSSWKWSIEELKKEVASYSKPTLILVSEGAKPIENQTIERDVGKYLYHEFDSFGIPCNVDQISYLSQTNSYSSEQEVDEWTTVLVKSMREDILNPPTNTTAKAIVNVDGKFNIIPIEELALLNPNSTSPIPLTEAQIAKYRKHLP